MVTEFFGQYDQYPFKLSPETEWCSDEGGNNHVAKKIKGAGFRGRALEQH